MADCDILSSGVLDESALSHPSNTHYENNLGHLAFLCSTHNWRLDRECLEEMVCRLVQFFCFCRACIRNGWFAILIQFELPLMPSRSVCNELFLDVEKSRLSCATLRCTMTLQNANAVVVLLFKPRSSRYIMQSAVTVWQFHYRPNERAKQNCNGVSKRTREPRLATSRKTRCQNSKPIQPAHQASWLNFPHHILRQGCFLEPCAPFELIPNTKKLIVKRHSWISGLTILACWQQLARLREPSTMRWPQPLVYVGSVARSFMLANYFAQCWNYRHSPRFIDRPTTNLLDTSPVTAQ